MAPRPSAFVMCRVVFRRLVVPERASQPLLLYCGESQASVQYLRKPSTESFQFLGAPPAILIG